MVTKAAAATTVDLNKPLDPRNVDFDTIIAQARRPKPKPVSIFLRHDLYSEIEDLDAKIEVLDRKIAGFSAPDAPALGVGDDNPAAHLQAELETLLEQRNPLVEQFNASEVVFEFRLIERGDRIKAKAAFLADGHIVEDDEENEIFPCYMMAQTCVTVNWPGAQWLAFRDQIGEFPFLPLQAAFQESGTQGMGITGPFSQRPLPTPSKDKS
jgi:hypothetical protein